MNELINQAIMHLFIGFGLALLNTIARYFAPIVPRVISVLRWGLRPRVLILAYMIALVLQLLTSPLFRSYLHSAYSELAWSPYQALFNVLGVMLMDLLVNLWTGVRRGAAVSRKRIAVVKAQAAEGLDGLGVSLALTPEEREAQAAREKARQEAEAQAAAERKQRIEDRLKDY